jgi:protein CpxP
MNKTSTFLTLSFAAAVTLSASAFAQNATPAPAATPGGRRAGVNPGERLKAMKEKLNLTDEQSDKVKAVFEKFGEQLKALRTDTTTPQQEKRAKFGEVFKAMNEEALAILTPEQQTKWKEEMEKRRAERGGAAVAPAPAPEAPKPAN